MLGERSMGRLQLNLHQVISFYFLAKEQSFSGAAELLGITQPAVTQHVRGLEVQYGVNLVNVKKKRVRLTKAGERLFSYAEELYNQALVIDKFLKGYRFNNISIGISSHMMFYFTALIDHFKERFPSVRISIQEGSSLWLLKELLDFKNDICIIGWQSRYNDKVRRLRIALEEQLVFVASPDYDVPLNRPLSWPELISHPLIIPSEGSSAREVILHQLKKRGLAPTIGAEVSNTELAKQLARQRKGLALMFEPIAHQEIVSNELRVVQLEEGDIRVGGVDVLVRRKEPPSPAVDSFLMLIRKQFKDRILDETKD